MAAVTVIWTPNGGSPTAITGVVDWASIQLNIVLTKEVGTLLFDVKQTPSTTALTPQLGDIVEMYEEQTSGNVLIFAGIVTETELTVDGGIVPVYAITVTDWGYLFDANVVNTTYPGLDPGQIVIDLVNVYCPGFTTSGVNMAGYTIPSIKFNYQPPSKCLQKLAQLIGWDWYIDANKNVNFFLGDVDDGVGEGKPAPFQLTDTAGTLEWNTIDYDLNTQNMKNSVYVIGSTYYKIYTQENAIDAYTAVPGVFIYPLVYTYDTTTIEITLGGVVQVAGPFNTPTPSDYQVLYSPGSASAGPFLQFQSDPGSAQIIVSGYASVPILAYAGDQASIELYGQFYDAIVDKQITTVGEAYTRALAQVVQYGHPVRDLKFNTLSTGLAIGQYIQFNSAKLGINETLLIKRIQATGYSPFELEYQVEAIGSDVVTFTDLMGLVLEQELNQNNVDDGTILQVLLNIGESTAMTEAESITTSTGPYKWGTGGANQLAWGLGSWNT